MVGVVEGERQGDHLRCFKRWGYQLANRIVDHYLGEMKVSEVLRLLDDDGWYLVATKGSHRQFKHSTKSGRITAAGKPSDDLAPGTLNSILKQAGLK